jgi:uncharacterized protein (TIGR00269 family)
MKCIKCEETAAYEDKTLFLCKNHFLENVEKKVERTIRKYSLIQQKDVVCVAASGGKDSTVALYLVMKHCRLYGIKFFALCIDEGIEGYRNLQIDDIKDFCSQHSIELHTSSFKEAYGSTLDDILKKMPGKKPCTICGILRRSLINRGAKRLHATKLITGHNLNDEAEAYLMNLFLGNMRHNAALGPITGINKDAGFVARIKPLYFVSNDETKLYSQLRGFKINFSKCPNITHAFRKIVRDHINEIDRQSPGARNALVNSFLEILPQLKEHYSQTKSFRSCKSCGDPCAGEVCNACRIEEELCSVCSDADK